MKVKVRATDLKAGDLINLPVCVDRVTASDDGESVFITICNYEDSMILNRYSTVVLKKHAEIEQEAAPPKGWFYIGTEGDAWIECIDGSYISENGNRLMRDNMLSCLARSGGFTTARTKEEK